MKPGNFKLTILISFCLFLSGIASQAQSIVGPNKVGKLATYTYSFTDGFIEPGITWTASNGVVSSSWSVGTVYYVNVLWKTTGSGNVKIVAVDGPLATLNVTISTCSTTITAPTLTGGTRCGTGTVTLSSSAPGAGNDIRWF